MLHHQERVARVPQLPQHADHPPHVPGVEADGGFIQHEEGIDEGGPQGRGQVDPLNLAPGQGTRLAVQGEVAEPHLPQVAEAGANLPQKELRRLVQGGRQRQAAEKRRAAFQGQEHDIVDGEAGEVA
ncbi:hypothetical protein [Geobacter anodireducens]|uniref:hypothetical protein n=1 Tax=Geobacter soli TaxID=1510391 RepID=UPI0011DF1081|nr:hypothetical protein [Geobacter soli]